MKKEYTKDNTDLNKLMYPFYGLYYYRKIGMHKNIDDAKHYKIDGLGKQQLDVFFGIFHGIYIGIMALVIIFIYIKCF